MKFQQQLIAFTRLIPRLTLEHYANCHRVEYFGFFKSPLSVVRHINKSIMTLLEKQSPSWAISKQFTLFQFKLLTQFNLGLLVESHSINVIKKAQFCIINSFIKFFFLLVTVFANANNNS